MERHLYDIIIYVFELLISFTFFSRAYDKKLKSNLITIIAGLPLFIGFSIIFSIFYNIITNLILFFILNFIYAKLFFKIPLKYAVINSILLDTIMFATEMMTIFMSSYLFKIPVDSFRNNLPIYIVLSSISKLFYLIFSQLLLIFIKKSKYQQTNTKQFIPLFLFPILTIATSAVFLLMAFNYEIKRNYQIAISIISTLYIFSCIFIFIYYQTLAANEAKINELESEQKLYNLNNTYMNILENQNDELQMLFHDTKHHYMALSSFESVEEVRQYIKKIHPVLENKNNLRISNNKTLDLILNNYISVCSQNDIKFTYETRTADLSYIDAAELIIILNNILDNAIEAAKNSNDKEIDLSLRHINNMDLLNVINSCDIPPKFNSKQLITTKANASSHGFGTRIIEKHTNKNHGNYDWFYDEIEHRFHLTIIFQPNQSSE